MQNLTGTWLTRDGDERIGVDPATRRNRYGCSPCPDPGPPGFGSCTASVISSAGFEAADTLRKKLLPSAASVASDPDRLMETQRMREECLGLAGIHPAASTRLLLGASGTDVLHLAAGLVGRTDQAPTVTIMVEPAESGSGVPVALAGTERQYLRFLTVREPGGGLRSPGQVDAETGEMVDQAFHRGSPVLLVLTDVTKTGLIVPSPECVLKLANRRDGQLTVLVDACQYRLTAATLNAYLSSGFLVALTGSKFFGGPPFSGALVVPAPHSDKLSSLREAALPLGQLLRWEAALEEWRRFRALPEARIAPFLQRFSEAVLTHITQHPQLETLPVPPLRRHPLVPAGGWDGVQTIFPFFKKKRGQTSEEILRGLTPLLGQPAAGAWRLCIGARNLVEALQDGEKGSDRVIRQARELLDHSARVMGRVRD